MRLSRNFSKTSRTVSSDETSKNAQLLIQAGFVHKAMPGVYSMLPLGLRVLRKIENIVRKHMDSIGGQEILMNNLQPKDWWVKVDNRWDTIDILFKVPSQTKTEYALSQSNEEQVTTIAKDYIRSYKDLPDFSKNPSVPPLAMYQIHTKFRDELRAKAGLMRGREFRMKDMYDFHQNEESQDAYYDVVHQSYLEIYKELGLRAYSTRASGGSFSKFSHEFQVETDAGEDWLVLWSDGVRENLEIAKGKPTDTSTQSRGAKILRENLGEAVKSAQNHADHAGVETKQILKTVLFCSQEQDGVDPKYVGVCIRGDLEINEELLIRSLEGTELDGKNIKEASQEQLEHIGAVRGRTTSVVEIASGYSQPILWIFDTSIEGARGMVVSLYEQVDIERDCVKPAKYEFLAEVKIGFVRDDSGVTCTEINRSAEVGNIFKLGRKWSRENALNLSYTTETNEIAYPLMGCHGIGITRCMGVIAEVYSDEKGIKWPKNVAPFQVQLITMTKDGDPKQQEILELAHKIYHGEISQIGGVAIEKGEVLWDDRDVSMGEKFRDAELIGCPVQLIITSRSLENRENEMGVEVKYN